jgi:hypothetical protein
VCEWAAGLRPGAFLFIVFFKVFECKWCNSTAITNLRSEEHAVSCTHRYSNAAAGKIVHKGFMRGLSFIEPVQMVETQPKIADSLVIDVYDEADEGKRADFTTTHLGQTTLVDTGFTSQMGAVARTAVRLGLDVTMAADKVENKKTVDYNSKANIPPGADKAHAALQAALAPWRQERAETIPALQQRIGELMAQNDNLISELAQYKKGPTCPAGTQYVDHIEVGGYTFLAALAEDESIESSSGDPDSDLQAVVDVTIMGLLINGEWELPEFMIKQIDLAQKELSIAATNALQERIKDERGEAQIDAYIDRMTP